MPQGTGDNMYLFSKSTPCFYNLCHVYYGTSKKPHNFFVSCFFNGSFPWPFEARYPLSTVLVPFLLPCYRHSQGRFQMSNPLFAQFPLEIAFTVIVLSIVFLYRSFPNMYSHSFTIFSKPKIISTYCWFWVLLLPVKSWLNSFFHLESQFVCKTGSST